MQPAKLLSACVLAVALAAAHAGYAYSSVGGGLISGHGGYGGYGAGYVGADGGYDGGHGKDYYAHPAYKFDYAVHDPHTGDVKNQWETRDGDVVKGEYSFKEADGTTRVVEYTSDKHNGFNAIVKRIGHAQHPIVYGHGHAHGLGY